STHIVEDVSELCSEMAILAGGRVLRAGRPADAIASLRGKVWQREVDRDQLPDVEARHPVISTSLRAGRIVVHVVGDERPAPEFEAVEPDLKDVYFHTLRTADHARAEAA